MTRGPDEPVVTVTVEHGVFQYFFLLTFSSPQQHPAWACHTAYMRLLFPALLPLPFFSYYYC